MTDSDYVALSVQVALAAGVSREEIQAALAAGWPWPAYPAAFSRAAPWLVIRLLTVKEMLGAPS